MSIALRKALLSIRSEFERYRAKYDDLFHQHFVEDRCEETNYRVPPDVLDLFFELNKSEDDWEHWHKYEWFVTCGRFFGCGQGLDSFKAVAQSADLVVHEIEPNWRQWHSGWLRWIHLLYEMAHNQPTPLLRLCDTWRNDFKTVSFSDVYADSELRPIQTIEQVYPDGVLISLARS